MKIHLLSFLMAITFIFLGGAAQAGFFASQEIQNQFPEAFVLQPQGFDFLAASETETFVDGRALLSAIEADVELKKSLIGFKNLSTNEKEGLLKRVFALEVQAMGITAPELEFRVNSQYGPAYFDFDVNQPSPGKVIIDIEAATSEKNPYAALQLLIHETRHSYQFQKAFLAKDLSEKTNFSQGFTAAFKAQKALSGQLGFCDFLSLNNEYEAFLYGNFVVGSLLKFTLDTPEMGTFASQFSASGKLKIDLPGLAREYPQDLLKQFNELEKVQYQILTQ